VEWPVPDNREEKAVEETAQQTEDTAEMEKNFGEASDPNGDEAQADDAAETSAAEEDAGDAQDAGKKGFFSKLKDKKDKKDVQIEELTDRVRRQMAEFDNYRKRTDKEKSAMYEVGARSVIEKLLPVVDNFERGLAGVEENSEDPFTAGMQKIYKQLMTTLESLDVRPIEAVGQEFNPDFHNAVMHVEDETLGENVVAEELQKGYLYRDSVVRHSMVKVAN
jgi:molecular chaperone GrpE